MLEVNFNVDRQPARNILCLGAHCDDIEIGCGGTLLQLLGGSRDAVVYWVVFSSNEERAEEARRSADAFLSEAKAKTVIINDFKNSFFPFVGDSIKQYFEQLKGQFSPDLIFTHYRNDLHQDHRVISDLTWNTFRNHFILEYEVPKYDGDLGSPNLFVHLSESTCQNKVRYVLENFQSQKEKHWFEQETFLSIMRLRGIEAASPSKYAEAYYCRKIILNCATGRDLTGNPGVTRSKVELGESKT